MGNVIVAVVALALLAFAPSWVGKQAGKVVKAYYFEVASQNYNQQ